MTDKNRTRPDMLIGYQRRMVLLCDGRFENYRRTIENLVVNIALAESDLMKEGFRMELKRVCAVMRADMYALYYSNEYQEKGVFTNEYEE